MLGWGTAAKYALSRKNHQIAGWGGFWGSEQPVWLSIVYGLAEVFCDRRKWGLEEERCSVSASGSPSRGDGDLLTFRPFLPINGMTIPTHTPHSPQLSLWELLEDPRVPHSPMLSLITMEGRAQAFMGGETLQHPSGTWQ